jgi:murein DD-endopeptidase MepM/ murein hydrolase activator NlpD
MVAKLSVIAASLAVLVSSGACAAQLRQSAMVLSPPVSAACISSPFGPRVLPTLPLAGAYHHGVDLPAPEGAPVVATAPGTIMRIQNKGPGGLEMLIQHDGFVGVYSHFGMIMPAFARGKLAVAAGEKLGVVGNTGITSGAHLYFEMILGGKSVDPAPYLGVPHCNGGERNGGERRTPTDRLNADNVNVPTRKYYQIFLPARQYYQWQRQ